MPAKDNCQPRVACCRRHCRPSAAGAQPLTLLMFGSCEAIKYAITRSGLHPPGRLGPNRPDLTRHAPAPVPSAATGPLRRRGHPPGLLDGVGAPSPQRSSRMASMASVGWREAPQGRPAQTALCALTRAGHRHPNTWPAFTELGPLCRLSSAVRPEDRTHTASRPPLPRRLYHHPCLIPRL